MMSAEDPVRRLRENWQRAVHDVHQAAAAAGRSPACVRIVAVTKYVDVETTEAMINAGCSELGEARPQQLVEKAMALAEHRSIRWHLIGPLQRNKVRRTLEVAQVIHSIDSFKLLEYVDRIAGELGKAPEVLIEVNISGEAAKHGFTPQTLLSECERLAACEHVKLTGLMGMAGLESDLALAQREFASLRMLRDRLAEISGLALSELSMGMSGDFVQAITEGATIVRIGTRLLDGVQELH
jgi:PLP dependent protein